MALKLLPGVAVAMLLCARLLAQDSFVPFVIPTTPSENSLITLPPCTPIQTDSPRLVARDGHFYVGDKRVKFWAVNLTFSACFPTHADAERLAGRLAAAGVNSVRFHHMDMFNWNNGIWDPADPKKLSAEALDRLDYLLDQLAKRGIYANLNLHVSRTHSKVLGLPATSNSFDKIIDIFTPELIEAQKAYARDLLTHVNAYRKVRYADDPAVGFVEISNEDSLFMWGAAGALRTLPEFYARILQAKYVAWLKDRYGTTEKLRAAWDKDASPLGENAIIDGSFAKVDDATLKNWTLEVHAENAAKLVKSADKSGGGRVEIGKADQTNWHIQLHQLNLKIKAGQYYTVQFKARADEPRTIGYYVSQSKDPWRHLGLDAGAGLTKEWKAFRSGFVASADEDAARLTFTLGAGTVAVEITDVSFRTGGREGLRKEESIEAGNIALFAEADTEARAMDQMRFLAETEKAVWDGMYAYIKKDLGCKALVTGTIVFGPLGLYGQSDMDFIDSHSYWQHPHFPGRPWDPANWVVAQKAMVDNPAGATLFRIACERLVGKPFTITEYNHSAPNDYQAECVPMFAAFGAAQDWDGVWFFDYGSVTDRQSIGGFFDVGDNPSKWGFMAAGAVAFRFGGITRLPDSSCGVLYDSADPLGLLVRYHQKCGLDMLTSPADAGRIAWKDLLRSRYFQALKPGSGATERAASGEDSALSWTVDGKGRGQFQALGPGATVWVGWASPQRASPEVTVTSPQFAAVMIVALDGQPFTKTKQVLIAACGRCENTDMQFSADRSTLGRNWGKPPVLIQAVDAEISEKRLSEGEWKLQPLGPDGKALGEPRTVQVSPGKTIPIQAKDKTMWWLLTPK